MPCLKTRSSLSPRDRAMRRVNLNLANCHATVQKLLIRQVLTKSMVWSWRFSWSQCVINVGRCSPCCVHSTMTRLSRSHCLRSVINKLTTDELWISPVYRWLAVAKFSQSRVWSKIPEGSTLIFEGTWISLQHSVDCRIGRMKLPCQKPAPFVQPF